MSDHHLPPGPRGRWLPTLQFMLNPHKTLRRWTEKYGDPVFLNALNGPLLMTGREDLIQTIFSNDPANYEIFAKATTIPILGEGSMLQVAGASHRRERKMIMPMFHGQRMRSYADAIEQIAKAAFEKHSASESMTTLDVTSEISLQVITEVIIGAEDERAADDLARLVDTALKRISPILFFSKKMQFRFFGISPWDRFDSARQKLRTGVIEEIRKRESNLQGREDIVSLMMTARYEDGGAMEQEHLLDELGTFLFAGHETSAVAMAWAVYYLLSNEEALQKLIAELDQNKGCSPSEMTKLPWLNAIVNESLRLNPVVADVVRQLKKPLELDGYRIPPGHGVAVAIVLAHYNEAVFDDPHRFDPARFIDRKYSSSQYLPFGGGSRRCAGAAFAVYEMAIVLGTLFSNYDLTLKETKPVHPKRRNVTLGPSSGILVEIQRRP